MTKQKPVNFYHGLNSLSGLKGVKFAYAVNKNLNNLKSEIEALQKALELSEAFKTYDAERVKLAEENAKKDEAGKAVVNGNAFVMENEAEFEIIFKALKERHPEAIAEREKQIADYNELLKTEASVELHKLSLADVPLDISTEQMAVLMPIISE